MSKKMQRRVSWGAVTVCVGVLVLTGLLLWYPEAAFHELEPVHAESTWADQDLPELCAVLGDTPEALIERYLSVAEALDLPEDLAGNGLPDVYDLGCVLSCFFNAARVTA